MGKLYKNSFTGLRMHKRNVLSFFFLLAFFGAGLFFIQRTYIEATGNAVLDSVSSGVQMPFNIHIQSADFKDSEAIVHIIASSSESRNIEIYSYLSVNGDTIAYRQDNLSAGANTPYSISLDLPYKVSQGTLIIYASDGTNDMKIVQEINQIGINGNVISDSTNSSFGIGAALIVGCIVLLLVIIFGIVLNRHRKQTKRVAVEQTRQRFIKLDVR